MVKRSHLLTARAWCAVLTLFLAVPHAAHSQTQTSTGQTGLTSRSLSDCDRLAAIPSDRTKPQEIPGVEFEDISAAAITACAKAVTDNPNNPRATFEYGRALDHIGRYKTALSYYKKAASLGHTKAKVNIGYLLSGDMPADRIDLYSGAEKISLDLTAALGWFEAAAGDDDPDGMWMAARMLYAGEGLSAPNAERAAVYWRKLADNGDAEASENLGFAMERSEIVPTDPGERQRRMVMAANNGRYYAAMTLASGMQANPDGTNSGARWAYYAYTIATAAATNDEFGSNNFQLDAILLLKHLVGNGETMPLPLNDYKNLLKDFSEPAIYFDLHFKCADGDATSRIIAWSWTRNYPPTDNQFEWLRQYHACQIDPALPKYFRDVFAISQKTGEPFAQMLRRANTLSQPIAPVTPPSSGDASDNHTWPLLRLAVVAAGGICVAAVDGCSAKVWDLAKTIALDVAKGAIRDQILGHH